MPFFVVPSDLPDAEVLSDIDDSGGMALINSCNLPDVQAPVSSPPTTKSARGLDATLSIAVADNIVGQIGALGASCTAGLFDLLYHYVVGHGLCLTQ